MRTHHRYWLVLLLTACGGGSEVASSEASSTSAAATRGDAECRRIERPYKGRCDTSFEMEFLTADGQQEPIGFAVHIQGTCQLTHLGRTKIVAEQTVLFGPEGQSIENEAVLTAANGDELYSTLKATGAPIFLDESDPSSPVIGFTFGGEDSYQGGTGRFGNAEGSATLTGAAYLDPPSGEMPPTTGTGFYEVSGTLTF